MSIEYSSRTVLRRLAWTGSGLALGLIVLGGVVRITGSGLGCGDHWPRCNGQWFPPLDLPTMIEIGHRWAAALVSVVVLALAVVAWVRHRREPALLYPATLAFVLLVVQVLLGAVTVKLALPPWVIITHLANAMVLLATLLLVALRASDRADGRDHRRSSGAIHRMALVLAAQAALGFTVILFGAQVANFHAGLLCLGLPLCNGSVLPPPTPLAALHWTHRVLAFAFLALAIVVVSRVRKTTGPDGAKLRRSAVLVLTVTLVQIVVASAMVVNLLPPSLRALHLFVGSVVWASLVVLVFHSARTPAGEADPRESGDRPSPGDLVTLTKPRIISLLLVTTIAPMFITPAGLPSLTQIFWVAVGGYLMAGGANAINMWFDRDIDSTMSRTRLRPIPVGTHLPHCRVWPSASCSAAWRSPSSGFWSIP